MTTELILNEKKNNLELLGEVFSKSLFQSRDFRVLLKKEAIKQFDYDFDVLYSTIKNETVENTTVKNLMEKNLYAIQPNKDLEVLVNSIQNLQLSIPVKIEQWDPATMHPTVVIAPINCNEHTINELKAFDSNCSKTTISAKIKPENPAIVIGESERVDKDGNVKVNSDGVIIPSKARISVKKALSLCLLKSSSSSIKRQSNFIEIISDEEYSKLEKKLNNDIQVRQDAFNKQLLELKNVNKKKSANAITTISFKLGGFSNLPNCVSLEWEAIAPMNSYTVYASGAFNVNGVKTTIKDKEVGNLMLGGNRMSISLPYNNELYTIYVKGHQYAVATNIGVSNYIAVRPSDRKEGCIEYLNRIKVSATAANYLEGWWGGWIDLCYKTTKADALSDEDDISYYCDYNLWGAIDNDQKFGEDKTRIFSWSRYHYSSIVDNVSTYTTNGAYGISWYEEDVFNINDQDMDILNPIVKLAAVSLDLNPSLTESVWNLAKKIVSINNGDEQIGSYQVDWWTPQNTAFPRHGCVFYHSYINP